MSLTEAGSETEYMDLPSRITDPDKPLNEQDEDISAIEHEEKTTNNKQAVNKNGHSKRSSKSVSHNPDPGAIITMSLPPYWIYHDHAFGVIWILFHKEKRYIGIPQLHWCLRFLYDLKDMKGEYTVDVNICIQAVQDSLMEQYANLGIALEKNLLAVKQNDDNENEKCSVDEEEQENVIEEKEQEVIAEEAVKGQEASTTVPVEDFAEENEEDDISLDIHAIKTSTPVTQVGEDSAKKKGSCDKGCGRKTDSSKQTCKPTSLVYDQMASRGKNLCTEQCTSKNVLLLDQFTALDIYKCIQDNMKQKDQAEISAEELLECVKKSYQKHLDKIRSEVEEMKNLEKFVNSINDASGSLYLSTELIKCLSQIGNNETQDHVKETN